MLVLFILGINAFHFYVIHIGDFLLETANNFFGN
jgi:hypothetical protein